MYWSHRKEDTHTNLIESSSLNGDDRSVLLKCEEPAESLALDFANQRLYYVYVDGGAISYLDLLTQKVKLNKNI